MDLYQLKAFLRYRLHAKGRHGVHSPFVYALVDECLSKRSPAGLEEKLARYFSSWTMKKPAHPGPKGFYELYAAIADPPPGTTLLYLPGIYRNAENTAAWNALAGKPDVTLSIDLYKAGLLFFTGDVKEKQHFTLKG